MKNNANDRCRYKKKTVEKYVRIARDLYLTLALDIYSEYGVLLYYLEEGSDPYTIDYNTDYIFSDSNNADMSRSSHELKFQLNEKINRDTYFYVGSDNLGSGTISAICNSSDGLNLPTSAIKTLEANKVVFKIHPDSVEDYQNIIKNDAIVPQPNGFSLFEVIKGEE